MRVRSLGLICLLLPVLLVAQTRPQHRLQAQPAPPHPVRWRVGGGPGEPIGAAGEFRAEVFADVAPGWHLYALDEPEGGPVALEFSVPDDRAAMLVSVGADRPLRASLPGSMEPVAFYAGQARFTLRLRMRAGAASTGALAISVRYQACDDRLCLPPRVETLALPNRLAPR